MTWRLRQGAMSLRTTEDGESFDDRGHHCAVCRVGLSEQRNPTRYKSGYQGTAPGMWGSEMVNCFNGLCCQEEISRMQLDNASFDDSFVSLALANKSLLKNNCCLWLMISHSKNLSQRLSRASLFQGWPPWPIEVSLTMMCPEVGRGSVVSRWGVAVTLGGLDATCLLVGRELPGVP